ncbi:IS3 family transposase [Vagococcus fluvialis]|nr:IS3 family transposase [Vagococcus fluvialis]
MFVLSEKQNLDACVTYDDVVTEVDDYMDYYNHYRGQWTLNRMTPQNYYESLCT